MNSYIHEIITDEIPVNENIISKNEKITIFEKWQIHIGQNSNVATTFSKKQYIWIKIMIKQIFNCGLKIQISVTCTGISSDHLNN